MAINWRKFIEKQDSKENGTLTVESKVVREGINALFSNTDQANEDVVKEAPKTTEATDTSDTIKTTKPPLPKGKEAFLLLLNVDKSSSPEVRKRFESIRLLSTIIATLRNPELVRKFNLDTKNTYRALHTLSKRANNLESLVATTVSASEIILESILGCNENSSSEEITSRLDSLVENLDQFKELKEFFNRTHKDLPKELFLVKKGEKKVEEVVEALPDTPDTPLSFDETLIRKTEEKKKADSAEKIRNNPDLTLIISSLKASPQVAYALNAYDTDFGHFLLTTALKSNYDAMTIVRAFAKRYDIKSKRVLLDELKKISALCKSK